MSRTARFVTLFRALESARPAPSRLFEDPLARELLDPSLRLVARAAQLGPLRGAIVGYVDRRWPGARTSIAIRTRLIDDALEAALHRGVGAVALLGAGFDCRAFRIPALRKIGVAELDRPEILAAKRERIERLLGSMPAHVLPVETDFESDDLSLLLARSGLAEGPWFMVWEGVTSYLSSEAVDRTLRHIRTASAPGSELSFTYLDRRALEGSLPGLGGWAATVDRVGEPFSFGFEPAKLEGYLAARGFELLEDVSTAEAAERYLRPLGRDDEASPASHVARARVV